MSNDVIAVKCHGCVFAQFAPGKTTLMQYGCDFDRPRKFEEGGTKVNRNPDHGFFEIPGRLCNLYRNDSWGANTMVATDKLMDVARQEVSLKVDALIYADTESSLYDVKTTIYSLLLQNPLPNKIVILKHNDVFEVTDIISMLRDLDMQGVPWSVMDCAADLELPALVDDAVRNLNGMYYAVFTAGAEIRRDFLNRLDRAYNDECKSFLMIEGDTEGNGIVLNTYMHKLVGGNKNKLLAQQLHEAARDQGWERMIMRFDEL